MSSHPSERFLVFIFMFAFFWFLAPGPGMALAQGNVSTAEVPQAGQAPRTTSAPEASSADPDNATKAPLTVDPAILEAPVDDTFLRQIWESRALGVNQMVIEASSSVDSILGSGTLSDRLSSANVELSLLMRLFQISRAYPAQQEDLLRQMQGLRANIQRDLDPLEFQKNLLTQRRQEVSSLKKDMAGLVFSETSNQSAKTNLEQASKLLEKTNQKINTVLEPGQILLKNLDAAIDSIEKDIPQTWRSYYLASFTASGHGFGLKDNMELIFKWVESMGSMSLFIYPQSGSGWLETLIKFMVTMCLTALLGVIIRQAAARSRLAWKNNLIKIIQGPWLWLILGFSLVIGSHNSLGGSYLALKLPGILALLWGLASLSWGLREAIHTSDAHHSPLARFYPPAAIGVIFLFLDCPAGPMTVGWFIVLSLFLAWLYHTKGIHGSTKLPLFDRITYESAVYFALASLLTTIFGYPRLAILVFMLLFTLVNIMILASALISLGEAFSDIHFDRATSPVKQAISKSLTIPLAFVLSLVCAVPWIWAVPGLEYLLRYALKSGYTVGDASFELSRVLFIVFLFFLFRSLMAFGLTSLDQFPKTFNRVNIGVVQPMKALFTYLVWTIYVIIALGILGVNFTSLAVVAGGLSVGVGLGLQAIFGNLVSGLMLMFGGTIMVGDLVEVGGVSGTVKSINIRSTVLETAERAVVYVPNSSIMSGQFVNWTRNHRQVRRKLIVQTVYGVDIALALQTMKEAALAQEKVVTSDPPLALFSEFGDNSLIFNLFVTISDIDFGLSTLSAIRMDIEQRFQAKGIVLYNPS
jgi:small-conductance mechanosensitive channel